MMMRVALVVMAVALVVASVSAQNSNKTICTPLQVKAGGQKGNSSKTIVINPALIASPSVLANMSNRGGKGSFTINVNLCAPGQGAPGCRGRSFVSAANETGCVAEFSFPVIRPTLLTSGEGIGFKVAFAQASPNSDSPSHNVIELVVLCTPASSKSNASDALFSRSGKFWSRPNKFGGTTYMIVASASSCFVAPPRTTRPTEHTPRPTIGPRPTEHTPRPTSGPRPTEHTPRPTSGIRPTEHTPRPTSGPRPTEHTPRPTNWTRATNHTLAPRPSNSTQMTNQSERLPPVHPDEAN